MNQLLGLLAVPSALSLLILVAALARHRNVLSAEAARKMVHVGMGAICCTFPWLFGDKWPVWLLGSVAFISLLGIRSLPILRRSAGSALHDVKRRSWGDLAFPIAVVGLWQFADGNTVLFIAPMLVLTLADATAAIVGGGWGRLHYQASEGHKSWEGSLAFFIVGFLAIHIPVLLGTDIGRLESLLIAAIIAVLVMIAEAIAWRGLDNVFIPFLVILLLNRLMGLESSDLAWRLGIAISLLVVAWVSRKRATVIDHAVLGGVLVTYAAYGLNTWHWLIPPLTVWLCYPRLTASTAENTQSVHGIGTIIVITAPCLIWAILAQQLAIPDLLWAWQAAWTGVFTTIALARLAHEASNLPWLSLLLKSSIKTGLLIAIPASLIFYPNLPALTLSLIAAPIAALTFSALEKRLNNAPIDSPRLLRQSLAAFTSSLPVAIYLLSQTRG